ncbi:hypothetical protein [Micromonospora fulviviridis]|uniref:hypothetical protein n=1 Tax=Micromonospora fulviviridis TaxID=47860 RepID=UPI0037A48297
MAMVCPDADGVVLLNDDSIPIHDAVTTQDCTTSIRSALPPSLGATGYELRSRLQRRSPAGGTGPDGASRIARLAAKDCTADPEARHGHKTSARGYDGDKGHAAPTIHRWTARSQRGMRLTKSRGRRACGQDLLTRSDKSPCIPALPGQAVPEAFVST